MKKILAFLLSIASMSAFAQITIDVGPGGDYNQSTPTATYGSAMVPNHQKKTFWFPGGICYIVRTDMSPDMMTLVTSMPEHLKISTVKMCISELDKIGFENKFQIVTGGPTETLKEARTSNLSCAIVGQVQTPLIYQIRFSNFSLTGKDREIQECMSKALIAVEKAPPLPPYKTASL